MVLQYSAQHGSVYLQQNQANYSFTLLNFLFSSTFLLTCNRKYNDISTFPANSIPHHHCSAIFLYGHAHLLKLLLAVWLSALIMSDILEMGAFKKGEKYNVTGWDTARKGLHYIYLLGNRILKVNIQKLLLEL